MPLQPGDIAEWTTTPDGDPQPDTETVPGLYQAAVLGILVALAAELTPPPGVTDLASWVAGLGQRILDVRVHARRLLGTAETRSLPAATRALRAVMRRGAEAAGRETRSAPGVPGDVDARASALVRRLSLGHPGILLAVETIFRDAVWRASRAAGDPGPEIQRVLDEAASRGITAFQDSRGRRWSVESWVETTVRSAYADAALAAYADGLVAAGVRVVRVGRSASPCRRCVPFEDVFLSIDGSGPGPVPVTWRGTTVIVDVTATIEGARAAGLFHPWCMHRVSAWMPGRGTRMRPGRPPDRVERARRRYAGRTARAWERRRAVALSPAARSRAGRFAAAWRRTRRGTVRDQ